MTAVEHVLAYIANEPPTGSRQLRSIPEGVDLLIEHMKELRAEVDARWGDYHVYRFDEATGRRGGLPPYSRVRSLTMLATKGDASALPPGEIDAIPLADRQAWALAEIAREVDAELERLIAYRATLDHARFNANRAQAPRRALQGVDKATALARKYENAAALAFDRTINQLAAYRHEDRRSLASERAKVRAETDYEHGQDGRDRITGLGTLLPAPARTPELGSFMPPPSLESRPINASTFTIGKPPQAAPTTPKPPRYTP